jgi:hypothetical protein
MTVPLHSCGNAVKHQMAPFAVNMKWSCPLFHFSLAMNTFHFFNLTLKSDDHSFLSGKYAVIIAR